MVEPLQASGIPFTQGQVYAESSAACTVLKHPSLTLHYLDDAFTFFFRTCPSLPSVTGINTMTKNNLCHLILSGHSPLLREVRAGIHIGTEVGTTEERCLLAGFLSHC